MKRVIAIWVGVIVVILIFGIITGIAGKENETEEPTIPMKEVVIGYDENGNPISENIPQDEESVKIDGQEFIYNPGAFANKSFKIEGVEIPLNYTIDNLIKGGLTQDTQTRFTVGESTLVANYNTSTGRGISLSAYTDAYVSITKFNVPTCKDFVLPSGVTLGKSTLEDIQRIYGTSIVYPASNNFCKTTKYYMDNTKATGFILMYFDSEDILCGVDIGCNISLKSESTN